jgi:phage I-like protein
MTAEISDEKNTGGKTAGATELTPAASYAIALTAAMARTGRLPIAQLGVRYKGKQRIEITRSMLADVVKNFRKRDTGEVPIDYEHAIELAAGSGDAVPAAGWIKGIDDGPDPEGILWGTVQWTPRAAGMIAAGEYKYVSPVIDPTVRDNKTGEAQGWTLSSAALTNTPVLQGMPALVLSERGWDLDEQASRGDAGKKEKAVKVSKVILTDRVAGTVRAVLDDGTEAQIQLEGLEAPPKVLRLSDVKRDPTSKAYDFGSLDVSGEGVLVAGEVFRAQQTQMLLSEAIKAGKILPSQRDAYEKMALGDLQSLVESMKPQIDMGTRGTAASEGDAAVGAGAQVAELVRAKITASKGKTPAAEALRLVLSENVALAREYAAEMNRRGQ